MRAADLSADDLRTLGHLLPRAALDLLRVAGEADGLALLNGCPGVVVDVPKSAYGRGSGGVWQAMTAALSPEALGAIVRHYGGTTLELPTCNQLRVERRNRWVRAQFDRLTAPAQGHSRAQAVALLARQAPAELGEVLSAAGISRVLDNPGPAAAVTRAAPADQQDFFA